jgi:ubiquinone biosynthesis protein COQ9
MDPLPPDPTLDEIRIALAPDLAADAAFDGWGEAAIDAAAVRHGIDAEVAHLAFEGAVDMIAAWFESIDRAMIVSVPDDVLAAMKVRARIATQV